MQFNERKHTVKNALILYIGSPERGQALAALAETQNNYVYLPENLAQALGMYISYFPQVTIIDMRVDYAEEALDHLRSVDARPLVLLGNRYIRSTSIFTLPAHISAETLLDALDRTTEPVRVSNGTFHYA
jgi:hypothetical protein